MSSKFAKKVSVTYDITKNDELIDDDQDVFLNYTNKNKRNKFDLILDEDLEEDLENDGEEQEVIKEVKPVKKKKEKKKKEIKIKPKELTEDELIDQFMAINQELAEESKNDELTEEEKIEQILIPRIRHLNEHIEIESMFGPASAARLANSQNNRRNNANPVANLRTKLSFGRRDPTWPVNRVTIEANFNANTCLLRLQYSSEDLLKTDVELFRQLNMHLLSDNQLNQEVANNNFQNIVSNNPFHPNVLLYLGHVLQNQEDFDRAVDCWKRVFYLYEVSLPYGFSLLRTSGKKPAQFDYSFRVSRPLFVALFQWILHLCSKSCFKTALEYSKVLLGLNVSLDPLAIILLIDDLCFRSNQIDYLFQFYSAFNSTKKLDWLPNYSFSLALAHYNSSQSELKKADESLQNALNRFPGFLWRLLSNLNVQFDDKIIKSKLFCSYLNRGNEPHSLKVLLDLYVSRSGNLWLQKNVIDWLARNCMELVDSYAQVSQETVSSKEKSRNEVTNKFWRELPLSIQRHLYLSRLTELDTVHFSPTSQVAGHQTDFYIIFDPVPPSNSQGGFDYYASHYDLLLSSWTSSMSNFGWFAWLVDFFRSFIPSFR